ncbi:M56 family metallopeptidase [Clostridium tetani]|uniref:M56 family metallopeptidase n=1 Tax=Clostridium tetani TaxID=1513 RepID=UPI0024A940CF|nr:M56 family metallopeptidase [Clostridium tetani]
MEGIFKDFITMSIKASIIALFIMAVRFTLGRKLPKRFSYYLWFVILIRLIVPINLVSKLSLFNYVPESNKVMDKIIENEVVRHEVSKNAIKSIQNTPNIEEFNVSNTSLDTVNSMSSTGIFIKIIIFIWIVGMVFLILKGVIKYYRACKILELSNICNFNIEEIKDKLKLRKKVQVYTLKGIESPMVYKFLKPRIIIPNSMKNELYKEETNHILVHELIHIKRQDNILIDIADKQIHPLEENFIGFGNTNIKLRVKNIMKYKRPKMYFTMFCIILISLIMAITLTNKDNNEIVKLEILHYNISNEVESLSIKDKKIINDLMEMIEKSEIIKGKTKLEDMEQMRWRKDKFILTKKDGSKEEIRIISDNINHNGYVEKEGKIKKPHYGFFKYMFRLMEYKKFDTNIEKSVVDLFKKYDWTVDYKINTLKEKIPENLKHNAGEYPVKLYWAYNNELSKQIGLDFTNYLGKTIKAEIYSLRDSHLGFEELSDVRGIILKDKNKIIGGYIDAWVGDGSYCSLDRLWIEDCTLKTWNEWIKTYINHDDELEIKLSKMNAYEIMREYYKALDNNDTKLKWATITRENLFKLLIYNMDKRYLFNTEKHMSRTNIKSAKLLELKKSEYDPYGEKNSEDYSAKADFKYYNLSNTENGEELDFYNLKKEDEKIGWRIRKIGKF